VEGALYYQQQGMNEPDEVLAATAEYRRSEDQMRDFVEECLEYQPGARTQANSVLDLYLGWWDKTVAGGVRNRPSKTAVGRQLKYILRDKKNVGGKVYYFDYVIKAEALSEYGTGAEK
jgi:phage/plasmid-associated DNA primase